MSGHIKVLLVEDEKVDQMAYSRFVQREGLPYDTVIAASLQEARSILACQKFDIILIDYFLGEETALDLLEGVRDTPTIVITGLGDEEIAVSAMKLGAVDYLTKDAYGNYLKTLPPVMANAIKLKRAENELVQYRENLEKMVVQRTEELTHANRQLQQEIVERKQAEDQVLLQATALESAVNGIMIIDTIGRIRWVNSSLEHMTGYSQDELSGFFPAFLGKLPQDIGGYQGLIGIMQTGIPWQGEIPIVRKDGAEFVAEMSFTPVVSKDGQVSHFISICQDVSEKIQAKQKLEYLATHDQLTGLPNRMLFSDRLLHALAIASRNNGQGAILLIDLDDFKAINDAFSHDVGDEFLKVITERFTECLRESDTVARVGGDEFAILLENIDQNDVSYVAQKLNWVLSKPAMIRENTLVTTASIGISMFPHDGYAVQQLLKNADLAMYRAKENKNSFRFYNHKMAVKIEKQMELTSYMRYALQNDIFQLHYQPQVDSKTGKVVGLEALLRLPHPGRKWISPTEFIPVAERTGQITSIDEWALRTAVRKMRELIDAGFHGMSMSVNLSNRQLNQVNMIDILESVLRDKALDPGLLELEISEGCFFRNTDRTINVMSRLKALGLKLAIDDFGTGYASLNYLARFPLDRLKIDRSFTRRILTSRSVSAVVTGVIAIANSLDLGIVVEGVENREQLALFSNLGCNLIQGFYYSPAVSESRLEALLKNGFDPFT